jgi:hypothetical protein
LEAQQMCQGRLLGFYEFEHHSKTEFKGWSVDSPVYFALEVLTVWLEGEVEMQQRQEMQAFIDEELLGWARTLSTIE